MGLFRTPKMYDYVKDRTIQVANWCTWTFYRIFFIARTIVIPQWIFLNRTNNIICYAIVRIFFYISARSMVLMLCTKSYWKNRVTAPVICLSVTAVLSLIGIFVQIVTLRWNHLLLILWICYYLMIFFIIWCNCVAVFYESSNSSSLKRDVLFNMSG